MPDLGSSTRLSSPDPEPGRVRRYAQAGVYVATALLALAMLAACAGKPPRIGERGELLVAPVWLPDGSSVLAYSFLHNRALLFDTKSGASRDLGIKDVHLRLIEFSRDGRRIFGTAGFSTKALEVNSGRLAWQWDGGGASIGCATSAELVLAVGREVVLLDAASGKARAALEAEPYAGAEGAFCSPDRRFLARQYAEGVVSVWDIAGRRRVALVKALKKVEPFDIALAPRAEWLAVWSGERIRLFRRDAWSEPGRDFPPRYSPPAVEMDVGLRRGIENAIRHGIEFSPDGQYLAISGLTKTSGLLPKTEQVLVNLHGMHVTRLPPETGIDFAFSPDGKYLALVGVGLRIWDIRAGALVTYPGH